LAEGYRNRQFSGKIKITLQNHHPMILSETHRRTFSHWKRVLAYASRAFFTHTLTAYRSFFGRQVADGWVCVWAEIPLKTIWGEVCFSGSTVGASFFWLFLEIEPPAT
jgi:hypothetical protein